MRLFGVNEKGLEPSATDMASWMASPPSPHTGPLTLPWLQDEPAHDAWQSWAVTYRDVVILDAANHKVGTYNVTTHDLGDPANYAALKALLLDAVDAP